ncbi:MAG: DUF4007 family protein [Candidatus Thiodiazotropha taylori]
MTVYFHGSFGLNRSNFADMLAVATQNPTWSDEELAKPMGYGKPFAQKYRSWLHKVGITEQGLPIKFTDKGSVVWQHDPKLTSPTTQWLIHHELTADPERAEAWHFFAHEFLPEHEIFSTADLLHGLTQKLRNHSEQHFGPGSKLNKTICRKIIDAYMLDTGLGELQIIVEENGRFKRGKPTPFGPWKSASELEKSYSQR